MDPITITPLTDQLNSFPHFMPNQVLTHTQLNELAFYLEQQDRFTRQRLIGIGIVCGLKPNLILGGNSITVEVDHGVGVTSCGFLIDIPEKLSFTKKKSYTTPADYEPFLIGPSDTPFTCIELKPDGSTESGVSNLTNNDVANKIVILFLDIEDKPNGKCLGENCDEKGNKWLFTLRVLLVEHTKATGLSDAQKILKKAYAPNVFNNLLNTDSDRDNFFNPEYQLPPVFVERLHNANSNADFDLRSIHSYAELEKAYFNVIESSSVRVAKALHRTYELFKPIFDAQLASTTTPFPSFDLNDGSNGLLQLIYSHQQKWTAQYLYDFVRDLVESYSELREELFALMGECSPDPTKFPRHLMIGELASNTLGQFNPNDYAPPTVYRNHFLYSPVMNGQSGHLKKSKMIISRLVTMIDMLNFSDLMEDDLNKVPIRITPDKNCCSMLSDQRIPFYYNKEGVYNLADLWNYKLTIQNRAYANRSYFIEGYIPGGLPADVQNALKNPLLSDVVKLSKLAVEGHVGKSLSDAVNELKRIRSQYNLSFDILALKLDSNFNEVYIADDNLIADLQTTYLTSRNELACCLIELRKYVEDNRQMIAVMFAWMIVILIYTTNSQATIDYADIYYIIGLLLDAYMAALDAAIDALPADIKQFDFANFASAFAVVDNFTRVFKYIINTWGDVEFFLVAKRGEEQPGNMWVLSDVVSIFLNYFEMYLDKIGDDCVLGKFYTIYTIFQKRVQTFCLFDRFNNVETGVHGMEHIAGTIQGGTFILVYEDEEEIQEFYGEIIDVNEAPVAMAYIVNAENESIVYGMTDNKGKYRVNVPKSATAVKFVKPGHVSQEVKMYKKSARKVNMASYADSAEGNAKTPQKNMSKLDVAYTNIHQAVNGVAALDEKYKGIADFIKIILAEKSEKAFVIADKKSFRVVADFYLPHLIHNVKTVVDPIDACNDFKEPQVLDYKAIGKMMKANAKMSAKSMENHVKAMYTHETNKK
ncbi:hypothetical protein [Pseudochryseolinea flava]|uniref:Carboxypeptidase regulatory-like domain-containing protein n=1 Tax=Pseudochryseolinea flava TaxID=2059302 RepID=A0A364Y403_9BACT|nr:hypothetical protein [Pseudochryseolinea flava]RAW01587.1 hypothetical protein DQQ10_07975 [Pseudochryseolinea flava]